MVTGVIWHGGLNSGVKKRHLTLLKVYLIASNLVEKSELRLTISSCPREGLDLKFEAIEDILSFLHPKKDIFALISHVS
jgi:hypothetical protein